MSATARATSKTHSYRSLGPEDRFRRFIGAIGRGDWKTTERLQLSAPRVRRDIIDPGFVGRIDALRRLTYRVLLVVLTATSWSSPVDGFVSRPPHWSTLVDDPLPPAAIKDIRRHLRDRVAAAAELWTAYDRFCFHATRKHASSIVAALSPGELPWLEAVIHRAQGGGLDEARIDDALQTMKSFWASLVESDDTVLILD